MKTTDRPAGLRLRLGALALLVVPLVAVGLVATPAGAHSGDQSYLYLDVTDETLSGRVEATFVDLRTVLGLDLDGTRAEILDELIANRELVTAYLADHVAVAPPGSSWEITFTDIELFESDDFEISIDYAVFSFDVDVAAGGVPRVFDVTFDPFLDEVDGRDHLLLIANDWDAGVFENGSEALLVFDAGKRTQSVDLGDTSQWKNFRGSVELGFEHIKDGPDHILFMLTLVLPSVLVFATVWRPAPSFGAALWRVLKIMTMFTIAHSITFTLAGLDIVPLPSPRIVESVIALSIAAAALHNLRPIAANKEWVIAFVFGLFHGLGFASLVETLEISRTTQLVSLLGRNVGIEIGQAVVIILVFPALFLLRRTRWYRPIFVGGSVLLAAVSLGWGWERIFETDIGVSDLIDPLVEPGRAVPLIVIATIVAAVVERIEASAGRLIPPYSPADDAEPTEELVETAVS